MHRATDRYTRYYNNNQSVVRMYNYCVLFGQVVGAKQRIAQLTGDSGDGEWKSITTTSGQCSGTVREIVKPAETSVDRVHCNSVVNIKH